MIFKEFQIKEKLFDLFFKFFLNNSSSYDIVIYFQSTFSKIENEFCRYRTVIWFFVQSVSAF